MSLLLLILGAMMTECLRCQQWIEQEAEAFCREMEEAEPLGARELIRIGQAVRVWIPEQEENGK